MEESDLKEEAEAFFKCVETLHAQMWDWSAGLEIPLEMHLNPHTRERLSDPLLYLAVGIARSIELKQAGWRVGKLTLDEAICEVYPMLGNAIQVAYEYINGLIDRQELAAFYGMMARLGSSAMKDSGPTPREPFFTPSSFYKRNGKEGMAHHVLKNRKTIQRHYDLLMRLEKKYKTDEDESY